MSKNKLFIVTNIDYDTYDEDKSSLPQSLEISVPHPKGLLDIVFIEGYLSDEITNRTGFCHHGFEFEKI